MHSNSTNLPVAVIGAGPVGLAAAAHLVKRGLRPIVLEARSGPGGGFLDARHVRLFSPWRFNIDTAARELLFQMGWKPPEDEALPTGADLIDRYLRPLSQHPQIAAGLRFGAKVVSIVRAGKDKMSSKNRADSPFLIRYSLSGRLHSLEASAVIDTSGASISNPLGLEGIQIPGEAEAAAQIAYGMPDVAGAEKARYAGKRTLVVGGGHSAAGTLLSLAALSKETGQGTILWGVRGKAPRLLRSSRGDHLPARGRLGTDLQSLLDSGKILMISEMEIHAITTRGNQLLLDASGVASDDSLLGAELLVDEIVCATGSRPDLSFLGELRIEVDPALESARVLAPLIDPNVHSCGTVPPHGFLELTHPEPNFFMAGAKSYGRAPTFLLATGYEQVRSVAAALAGDMKAATTLELVLPGTGVCSSDFSDSEGGCCVPALETVSEPAQVGSCCT